MDLAILVYSISVLSNLGALVIIAMAILFTACIFPIVMLTDSEGRKTGKMLLKWFLPSLIVLSIIAVFIPSEKVMYTMVGAYATEKIAKDPKVQELGGKVLTLIEGKLDDIIAKEKHDKK